MLSGISGNSIQNFYQNIPKVAKDKVFNRLDHDQSGALDKAEINSFAQRVSSKIGHQEKIEQVISKIDKDQDGQISLEEFQAFVPGGELPRFLTDRRVHTMDSELLFGEEQKQNETSSVDLNQDGIIDSQEAEAAVFGYVQQQQMNLYREAGKEQVELVNWLS